MISSESCSSPASRRPKSSSRLITRQRRPGQANSLGGGIGFHRTVIVEVVAGQIGEHRDIETERRHAALVEAVGRHFHRYRAGAGLLQRGQRGLHRKRVRRGVPAALQGAVETGAEGADDAAALAEQIQYLGHQLADAGLAVGAGDADQVQPAARLAVNARRPPTVARPAPSPRSAAHRWAAALRRLPPRKPRQPRPGQGIGDVRTTILAPARHRQEQVARTNAAAIQGQLADQQIALGLGKQLVQAHRHQPRPPLRAQH